MVKRGKSAAHKGESGVVYAGDCGAKEEKREIVAQRKKTAVRGRTFCGARGENGGILWLRASGKTAAQGGYSCGAKSENCSNRAGLLWCIGGICGKQGDFSWCEEGKLQYTGAVLVRGNLQ